MRDSNKNIIIGAGLSGLSCARELKDCMILEKNPVIGGLARTKFIEKENLLIIR